MSFPPWFVSSRTIHKDKILPMLNDTQQTETNLSLWKYFTDDAAKIKDRMWTMASWLFTLQAGLLAFASKYLSTDSCNHLMIENRILVIITAAMGIVLSGFTIFMIQQYGQHIRGMWNRADFIRRQTPGLTEIWLLNNITEIIKDAEKDGKADTSLPPVAKRLLWLGSWFTMVFIVLLCVVLLKVFQ